MPPPKPSKVHVGIQPTETPTPNSAAQPRAGAAEDAPPASPPCMQITLGKLHMGPARMRPVGWAS